MFMEPEGAMQMHQRATTITPDRKFRQEYYEGRRGAKPTNTRTATVSMPGYGMTPRETLFLKVYRFVRFA